MGEAIFLGAIVVAFITILFLAGKNKDSFVRHFSRGAYMRELNKKMEQDMENQPR